MVSEGNDSNKEKVSGTDTPKAPQLAGNVSQEQIRELLKRLSLSDKQKAPKKHEFWNTQPVPQLEDDTTDITPGPIKTNQTVEKVPKECVPLPPFLEWCTCDIMDDTELSEIYELLYENYVEDDDNMFRFNYSRKFLRWALTVPNFQKEWHVGIREREKRTLVGFITAIPLDLVILGTTVKMTEVNFLCVNKLLRSNRLAPVLIAEITRRINLKGIWQAVYTAGALLTKPIAEPVYFHRPLNFKKLVDARFTRLRPNMKMSMALRLYSVPDDFTLSNIRLLRKKDIPAILKLLAENFQKTRKLYPAFSKAEAQHMLLPVDDVVASYVRTDDAGTITDFFSFYFVPSTVVGNTVHSCIKAAYSFYHVATSVSLTELVQQALIAAKKLDCDVFNILDLGQNASFLDDLKFGRGDGSLKYYLFNYKVPPLQSADIGLAMI